MKQGTSRDCVRSRGGPDQDPVRESALEVPAGPIKFGSFIHIYIYKYIYIYNIILYIYIYQNPSRCAGEGLNLNYGNDP